MTLGNNYSLVSSGKITKFIYRLLSTLDLCMRFRLRPVNKFFQKYFGSDLKTIKVLELRCSNGINAFEISKVSKKAIINLSCSGVDLSYEAIDYANQMLYLFGNEKVNIHFFNEEEACFLERQENFTVDIIFLMDVIEYIKKSDKLLYLSKDYLKKNGLFVVSVPISLYLIFFGRKFHNIIGHLVDGYYLNQFNGLFNSIGCQRITDFFQMLNCSAELKLKF